LTLRLITIRSSIWEALLGAPKHLLLFRVAECEEPKRAVKTKLMEKGVQLGLAVPGSTFVARRSHLVVATFRRANGGLYKGVTAKTNRKRTADAEQSNCLPFWFR
jgi:hypothetical protein